MERVQSNDTRAFRICGWIKFGWLLLLYWTKYCSWSVKHCKLEVRAWKWFCRKKWLIKQSKKSVSWQLKIDSRDFFCLGCCSSDSMCYILMLFSLDCYTSVKFVLLSLCWAALWPWYSVNVELLYADLYCWLGIICGVFSCLRSQPLANKMR